MATASFTSLPTPTSDLETPLVQPVRHGWRPTKSGRPENTGTEASTDAADLETDQSLRSRLAIDPKMKESRLGLDDICNLLVLFALGAAAISLPAIMVMKVFSSAAQFSSLDIMRMMAGMP